MKRTSPPPFRKAVASMPLGLAFALGLALLPAARAQRRPMDVPSTIDQNHRIHLILKDGSYQLVLTYRVDGGIVRYRSAERNGAVEEIPLSMVDLDATKKWEKSHAAGDPPQNASRPVLSPELAREEADRAAITPEIAPDLRLPEEDSVLVLDTFHGTPELVPLPQQGTDLNKETAHAVLKTPINPASAPHRILDLPDPKADVQLHVPDPIFFVRIGPDLAAADGGSGFTVDTHGAGAGRPTPTGGAAGSQYVLERLDPRQDTRELGSFQPRQLGYGHPQADLVELKATELPGGHWLKLTPKQPLEFGEYALVEVLDDHSVNLNVWDFGVHPTAPENVEAQRPQPRRAPGLQRH